MISGFHSMYRQFCSTFFLDQLDIGIQTEQEDLLIHALVHRPMLFQHQLTLLPILSLHHCQPTHLPNQATHTGKIIIIKNHLIQRLEISNLNLPLNLPGNHIKRTDIKVQCIGTNVLSLKHRMADHSEILH